MKNFQRPYGLRLLMFLVSVVSLGLGLWGVSVCRDVGIRSANVEISTGWYWLAITPPVAVIGLAFTLPPQIISWRRGILPCLFGLVSLVSASTAPLLYVVYDFEHRLREHLPSPNHPAQARPGSRLGWQLDITAPACLSLTVRCI